MLTKYIGKFFADEYQAFKVIEADKFGATFLICPYHLCISSSNQFFIEETIDAYTFDTANALRRIERAREITKEEFKEVVDNYINELLEKVDADEPIKELNEIRNDALVATALTAIQSASTAEPRKGKWIETNWHTEWYGTEEKCSVCGESMLLTDFRNYCPNCGAKMEENE